MLRIEGRVSATLIPAVWERLLRLPSRFFAGFSSGDLALRAMGSSEVFKKASGAVVTSIVTGVFSLFNLALLYAYSWRLALGTTLLLAPLAAGDDRAPGRPAALRDLDRPDRRRALGPAAGALRRDHHAAQLPGPRAAPWRVGRTLRANGSRLLIRSRRFSNAIHQWLAVYPILTAMVVYTGAIHIDPGLMKAGSFLAFNIAFANLVAAVLAGCYTSIGCSTCCRRASGSGRSSKRARSSPRP